MTARRLAQVAEVALGRQRTPAHEHGENLVPYLRSANVRDGELDLTDVKQMNFTPAEQVHFSLRRGDVLVTEGSGSRETVGASAVWNEEIPGPVCFQNTLLRLRPRGDLSDGRFLYWWMRHAHAAGMVAAVTTGANIQHLGAESLRGMAIDLPSLDDQRMIARFLDCQIARADEIIRLREEQAAAVKLRLEACIRDLVAGAGEGCRTPHLAPWVGNLHKRAELRPLVRSLVLQRGVDLTAVQRVNGPFPVITTAGVVGMHDQSIAEGPGIVIGRYGTVGNVHWVDSAFWPHNTTLYVKDFRENEPRWLYWLLRAFPYEMQQARAAVPGVNRNEMHPVLMPWLPLDLQKKSADLLDAQENSTDALSAELNAEICLVHEWKRSLITAAVTGGFDVTAASGRRVA
ncbi:restriction endonuclease subunit S [Speluncibacter jeojiensis]|uniref:Restriction endonuclease subunit S n=1 Tax=Speluncibacter jeojiensis TaxID=2710754 RepID=A0A9X4LZL0_9ACTN|nr:restriction endonuclease subunit S [Corynebacteriales bacterium D3-21]